MKYHKSSYEIVDLLKKNNYWYETFEHEPVRTSEEAAKIRDGYTLSQGAKAILIRVKKVGGRKEFVMLVYPADKKFDNGKVKKLLVVKDIRFAEKKEISDITEGIEIGGVHPFGSFYNLKVIADKTLFKIEKIIFNAGDRSFSVGMKSEDYKKLEKPITASII